MKLRYNFFLIMVGALYLPGLVQAKVTLPSKPLLHNMPQLPLLHAPTENRLNALSSSNSKVDQQVAEITLLHKAMRAQAMVQRSWISSMVVPGLGQVYNKDYWKVPCFYLGFVIACSRVYSEHEEMNKHKRTLLLTDHRTKPNDAFTQKRIKECERTRNLFAIIAAAWYLLNVFDAYAGGHDRTVNFKNDIGTNSIVKPAVATVK